MNNAISQIHASPEIMGGTPVFQGTRVPFEGLIEYLEDGKTIDDFVRDFPSVTRAQAALALEEAMRNVERIAHEDSTR